MNWILEYEKRVNEELLKGEKTELGNKFVSVKISDLLIESGLPKGLFYKILFFINKEIDEKIVLYIK